MNAEPKAVTFTTAADRVKFLCDNPSAYFGHSFTRMQTIPRQELADLQLEALQYRFSDLRDRIPMLKKLADNEGVEKLDTLDEIVPLLFEHTMYKSYPPSLLENGKFAEINKFLSKLTTFDLTGIDVSQCDTIDGWMETMDRESPLLLMHSSGTTGTMSFLPMSRREWTKFGDMARVTGLQEFGVDPKPDDDGDIYSVYPYFRYGGSSHVRMCELFVSHISGSEDKVLTAYPGRMSADILYLGAKVRAAQAKGDLSRLKISPSLLARKSEYEALMASMPERLLAFFMDVSEKYAGKRIFFWGAPNLLYAVAKIGLEKGKRQVFAPNSSVITGGERSVKDGTVLPPPWKEDVCDFIGIKRLKMGYGMSETCGLHMMCTEGRYHFSPWIIPFVLDPDTSKPLPRTGKAVGRAAFFDLGAETRWGGFISGDEISVDWDTPCACGRTTAWAEDNITRYSALRGGDDKISCAATENAHKDAMNFLTKFE